MKLYLISYPPGYSGDFLSYQVHQDSKFYPINNIQRNDNRFMFPSFTKSFDSKMTSNPENLRLINEIDFLKKKYNKNLCINTHISKHIDGPYEKKKNIYSQNTSCWFV